MQKGSTDWSAGVEMGLTTSSGDRLAELKSLHKKNFSVYQETTESGQMVSQSFHGSVRGLCLTWDVTVPDTHAMSHLAHTSINAGEAAERAAESKRTMYSTITNTHAIVAVVVETEGAWCREGLQLISELGSRIRDATHDPMETSYIFQRISVALQRENAICISGTLPPLCKEFCKAPKQPVSNGPANLRHHLLVSR